MTNKIMIVDDDNDLRDSLEEILTMEGMDVIAAEDGYKAIQLASENQISLIFMDIRMPGIDGVETFLKIKDILPDCTVVMMTGYALEELIQRALLEGAKACLSKPVSIEQILEITNEVLTDVAKPLTNKIMIVDDDNDLRDSLEEILTMEGMDVIAAEDGYKAIQLASENQISLIFMDIRMPGIDGVETFLRIKEILPVCTVVMMTGYALEELIQRALSEGAKYCLSKPVSIEQILDITSEVLSESVAS